MQDDKSIVEANFQSLKLKVWGFIVCCALLSFGWGIGPVASCTTSSCSENHAERIALIEATGSPYGVSDRGCGDNSQVSFLRMKYAEELKGHNP